MIWTDKIPNSLYRRFRGDTEARGIEALPGRIKEDTDRDGTKEAVSILPIVEQGINFDVVRDIGIVYLCRWR